MMTKPPPSRDARRDASVRRRSSTAPRRGPVLHRTEDSSPPVREQLFPDIPEVRVLARAGLNFCPLPDAQGIQEVVALYRDDLGSAITEAEAEAILARVIRFLWAINLPASRQDASTAGSQTDSAMPAPPPTTAI